METELLYSETCFVPLNVNKAKLKKACESKNVTFDKIEDAPRVYKFYAERETDLRFIIFTLLLKIII